MQDGRSFGERCAYPGEGEAVYWAQEYSGEVVRARSGGKTSRLSTEPERKGKSVETDGCWVKELPVISASISFWNRKDRRKCANQQRDVLGHAPRKLVGSRTRGAAANGSGWSARDAAYALLAAANARVLQRLAVAVVESDVTSDARRLADANAGAAVRVSARKSGRTTWIEVSRSSAWVDGPRWWTNLRLK